MDSSPPAFATRPDAVGGSAEVSARAQWRRDRLIIVSLYFAARAASILGFALARLRDAQGPWSATFGMLDGGYYLRIAAQGYPSAIPVRGGSVPFSAAFFPLYPMTIRFGHITTGLPRVWVAVVISVICGLAATLLLHKLLHTTLEADVARRTAFLFAVFPGTVIFSLAYAEGLMMLLIVACLLALVRERWLLAGVLGAAATATRAIAIALVLAAAYAAWVAWRQRHDGRAPLAPMLIAVGFFVPITYQWWLTGEPRAWLIVEDRGWHQQIDFGYRFVAPFVHPGEFLQPKPLARTGALVAVLAALWLLRRVRVPSILIWYTVGVALQFLLSSTVGPRPRFLMTAFPLLIGLAYYLKRRALFVTVLAGSLIATIILAAAYARPGFMAP
jgi:hypothetical protein